MYKTKIFKIGVVTMKEKELIDIWKKKKVLHISMDGIFLTLREDIRKKRTCLGIINTSYWIT